MVKSSIRVRGGDRRLAYSLDVVYYETINERVSSVCLFPTVCLFATGLKKTKAEGKKCHDKTRRKSGKTLK